MPKRIATYLLLVSAFLIQSCAFTPAVRKSVTSQGVKPVAELTKIPLGGIDQWILVRGVNPSNPVLLFLHGGPGAGEMPLLRHYNNELEKYFTVVMWDQRGAGKNNRHSIPAGSINMDQLLDDTHELTAYLKARFCQQRIFLAGHSLGTALGIRAINQYPDDYYAYVGIGQVVNMRRNIELSYQLSHKLASEIGRKRDIRMFSGMQINGKYSGGSDLEKAVYMRDWIAKNGRIYYKRNNINNLVGVVLLSPEYSPINKMKYMNGLNRSRRLLWTPDLFDLDFFAEAPSLQVPLFIVSGNYDYITAPELTREYFDYVEAPEKHFLEFEYSAQKI